MSFLQGYRSKYVFNTIDLEADASQVWEEITNVKVARFSFPWLFRLFGIPKPLSAEVIKAGVGGYRMATFDNDAQFQQDILEWELYKIYRFRFNPTDNFRVGHFMKLSNGPFQIATGGYELKATGEGIHLILSSNYRLNGVIGAIMHVPFRLVVYGFQRYLLRGIADNLKQ